ncbi:hypothetical protein VTP01DRAFT_5408 [Rhizomucor pusillus]|uniref:uncharacterized protein n=1 Tax=Rhizomucor pusillus TaxID=4840 RepID=UPI003743D1CE
MNSCSCIDSRANFLTTTPCKRHAPSNQYKPQKTKSKNLFMFCSSLDWKRNSQQQQQDSIEQFQLHHFLKVKKKILTS